MKSPFPGMDPWFEGHVWPDVHHGLAFIFKELLVSQVVPKYFVRVETYTVEDTTPEEEVGIMYPDVEMLKKRSEPSYKPTRQTDGGLAMVIPGPVIEVNIPVVEIRDRDNQQLNHCHRNSIAREQAREGAGQIPGKTADAPRDGVHLLEVDLLRRGKRPLSYPALPRSAHYLVMLSRGDKYRTEVWAMTVREPLPIVPVPLKAPDPDVRLDIGAAFNEVYDRSRYELSVQYSAVPPPTFSEQDMQWLQSILNEKKLAG